ncbi:hypothetical protein GRI94_15420 [Erythrobacter jejuensis]|uniref:Uncharacterized protein n=2 Tax=Parerythrobacter jejuensis TaxID=795812 RepID=A0A845AV97_9SPHN|nr:hypothetical protein [Parerythrobacter jejuensis]MXP33217.1 hypothetical protein [Parerythrobacter jejuensis]
MLVTNAGPAETRGASIFKSDGAADGAASGTAKGAIPANYLTKLLTLFPTEIVGIYTAMVAIWGQSTWWIATASLLALLILRYVMLKADGKKLLWQAYLVSIVSFILWLFVQKDAFVVDMLQDFGTPEEIQKAASALAVFWAGIMPAITKLEAKE